MKELEAGWYKIGGNPEPESMSLLYGGHADISLLFCARYEKNLQNDT